MHFATDCQEPHERARVEPVRQLSQLHKQGRGTCPQTTHPKDGAATGMGGCWWPF